MAVVSPSRHAALAPSSLCSCLDCLHPTPENRDRRLIHAEYHREFAERFKSQPTLIELGRWTALRIRLRFEDTTLVSDAWCRRPDHEPWGEHTAASHRR